jgi:hypothetical protein
MLPLMQRYTQWILKRIAVHMEMRSEQSRFAGNRQYYAPNSTIYKAPPSTEAERAL